MLGCAAGFNTSFFDIKIVTPKCELSIKLQNCIYDKFTLIILCSFCEYFCLEYKCCIMK